MKARVVNTKHPDEIIKTFNDVWIEEGPGLPTIGIFSDNGGEFKKQRYDRIQSKTRTKALPNCSSFSIFKWQHGEKSFYH